MDPIGASCFSLHAPENAIQKYERQESIVEHVTSNKSLSKYDSGTFKSLLPQITSALLALSINLMAGVTLAFSAIMIPQLNLPESDIKVTQSESAWMSSIIILFAPVAIMGAGITMDYLGRLNTTKLAIIPMITGYAVIALANNTTMLIIGRTITGISYSWGCNPGGVYATEIARADMRGTLVSIGPGIVSLGMMLTFFEGWLLHWRTIAWLSVGYSLIPLLTFFAPESPPWLVSKGRDEQALKSLKILNKHQPQPVERRESLATLHLQLLQKERDAKLKEQNSSKEGFSTKLKELLKPTAYKPLLILFGLFFFQQFSGIYITLLYSVDFFKEAGGSMDPYLASIIIGAIRFVGSCLNTYMLKSFKRRPLIIISGIVMAVCIGSSGLFTKWIKEGTSTQTWMPTYLILGYVIASMIGILPIPWTMTAEMFPLNIRSLANAIIISISQALMYISVQMYYSLMDWCGGAAGLQCLDEYTRAKQEEQKRQEELFITSITSIRSLGRYEVRSFKTLCPQIISTAIAASFHIAVGIGLAYSAILLPQLNFETSDIKITENEGAWIASAMVLIVPLGSISGGFIMDTFGRLNCLKLSTIPNTIGWVTLAMAYNVPMLIVGRVLTGFATSWCASPAVVYITEIARIDMRGSLISFGPAYASFGMVLVFIKGYYLSWRTVAWMGIGYAVIPAILVQFFVQESPAWLISKGRIEEALKSLKHLNKYQPKPEHRTESLAELQLQLLQKEHQIKLEEASRKGDSGLLSRLKQFSTPIGYKPLIILFWLFFLQQFSGIYITLFYSVAFFNEIRSPMNPYLASVLIGTVRMCMSCINTYMLKTFSRRPLIMLSGVGMAICMGFSGLFTTWILEGSSTQTWVPTCLLLLYVITSMIGLLPIPWTMTAELFPIEIRGVAHSIAYSIANILMFASVQMYYTLFGWFGGIVGIQWFFAIVSILASIYTYIFLPETHGKKLSDITDYFTKTGIIYLLNRNKPNKNSSSKPDDARRNVSRVPKKDIVKANNTQNEKLLTNNA